MIGADSGGGGAIAGLRVVDLTRVLGGPYCTQILADHGAEVIKVEPPQGDETRDWGPPFHEEDASYFIGVNRNKRSIALDLAKPAARELLLRLLATADVLVENFKPGTLEKWEIGKDLMQERFPRLVHCTISGFGADGPLGRRPGYDAVVQAMVGMFSVNGPSPDQPTRLGVPMVDLGTGLYSALAIMMALFERQSSGRGQHLDMTLYDCGLSLMHPHAANYFLSGEEGKPTGNAHTNISPYDSFRTATVPLFLAIGNNPAFKKLCQLLEAPELAEDPRFLTNQHRLEHRDALKEALEAILMRHDGDELWPRLIDAGLPAGPIYSTRPAIENDHTRHRRMIVDSDWYRGLGTPIKMSRSRPERHDPPPRFAEHTDAILDEVGLGEEDRQRLIEEGALIDQRRKLG